VHVNVLFSEEARKHGFSVIIDMRGSTWHNVKPILRVLQVRFPLFFSIPRLFVFLTMISY
jgi:hypothetical protein